ncbi:MAG: hypothetical protein HQM08_29185 [Candidatus Riflebacteria bacterium]|nr:hypothetical protein [Candidatus Riflebacteria bacterium]
MKNKWDLNEHLDNINYKLDAFRNILLCEAPPELTIRREHVVVTLDMVCESVGADIEAIRKELDS